MTKDDRELLVRLMMEYGSDRFYLGALLNMPWYWDTTSSVSYLAQLGFINQQDDLGYTISAKGLRLLSEGEE